jgi:periplasmic divalent cation tolerance protein
MKDEDPIMVMVTAPDRDVARMIAASLVEKRMAACVNILPGLESMYRWEGKIQNDQEIQLIIKTHLGQLESNIIPLIQELHPYDLPEIVATQIIGGSKSYLEWIIEESTF